MLYIIHPASGSLVAPSDDRLDQVKFLLDIAAKYGFMMCDPVSELSDRIHGIECFTPDLLDG